MADPELLKRVEDWLRDQGYPLEMRTARVFRRRGWFLHHSRRYKDPTLGKEREIDVLAFYDDRETDPTLRIHGAGAAPFGFWFAKGAGFDFSFVSSAQSRKEASFVA